MRIIVIPLVRFLLVVVSSEIVSSVSVVVVSLIPIFVLISVSILVAGLVLLERSVVLVTLHRSAFVSLVADSIAIVAGHVGIVLAFSFLLAVVLLSLVVFRFVLPFSAIVRLVLLIGVRLSFSSIGLVACLQIFLSGVDAHLHDRVVNFLRFGEGSFIQNGSHGPVRDSIDHVFDLLEGIVYTGAHE